MPRMRLLPPGHALKVLLACLKGRNAPVKTIATAGQIDGIDRQSVRVPTSMTYTVSYLQTGTLDGRRIIFLHGTPGNAKGWVDYLLDVPGGRLHIALDRLGYGFSNPKHAVVSLKRQAQAVVPFLKVTKDRKAILVGHSSGASVAVQTALDYPDSVGGLLLLAGAFDPDLEEASWLQPFGTLKSISRLLPRVIDNANRELLGLRRGLLAQADRLHQISMPVGVVHGDSDPLVPSANLNYLQRKLNDAPLDMVMVKHGDHFIPWNSKATVEAALKRLIDKVRQAEV